MISINSPFALLRKREGIDKMKMKSIKVVLAGILAVPMMALGVSLFTTPAVHADSIGNIANGANASQANGQANNLFGTGGIFSLISNTALFIIGAISVLMLIYGGIRYTISAGDDKAVTAAKNTILYAVVGIVVALLAYALVNFVISSLIPNA
jgi:ABC-type Fe3+ transport system permease subunit